MPSVRRSQNEAQETHRGNGLDIRLSLVLVLKYSLVFKAVFPNPGPMGEGEGGDKEEFRHRVLSPSTNFVQLLLLCMREGRD
ncbi:hypothetical protein TNCV_4159311 [Trichonephila clavipes]|nr:hypothetical protein TNCV_4159311 [Trichonephila clavipes]